MAIKENCFTNRTVALAVGYGHLVFYGLGFLRLLSWHFTSHELSWTVLLSADVFMILLITFAILLIYGVMKNSVGWIRGWIIFSAIYCALSFIGILSKFFGWFYKPIDFKLWILYPLIFTSFHIFTIYVIHTYMISLEEKKKILQATPTSKV